MTAASPSVPLWRKLATTRAEPRMRSARRRLAAEGAAHRVSAVAGDRGALLGWGGAAFRLPVLVGLLPLPALEGDRPEPGGEPADCPDCRRHAGAPGWAEPGPRRRVRSAHDDGRWHGRGGTGRTLASPRLWIPLAPRGPGLAGYEPPLGYERLHAAEAGILSRFPSCAWQRIHQPW